MLDKIIFAMGIGRILIGLAPFLAAGLSVRLLSIPGEHDNPSARLLGRMFGVRDVGLGVLVFYALQHREILSFVILFNACTDFGDAAAIAIPLLRRQGIDRAAVTFSLFAVPAGISWLVVRSLLP